MHPRPDWPWLAQTLLLCGFVMLGMADWPAPALFALAAVAAGRSGGDAHAGDPVRWSDVTALRTMGKREWHGWPGARTVPIRPKAPTPSPLPLMAIAAPALAVAYPALSLVLVLTSLSAVLQSAAGRPAARATTLDWLPPVLWVMVLWRSAEQWVQPMGSSAEAGLTAAWFICAMATVRRPGDGTAGCPPT